MTGFNYYRTLDKSHLQNECVDEIMFRRTDSKGGEAAIRWYVLDFPGRRIVGAKSRAVPVPKLEMWSDGWIMLPDLAPLLAFLSQNPGGSRQQLTPEQVMDFMSGQGWTRGHAPPPKG